MTACVIGSESLVQHVSSREIRKNILNIFSILPVNWELLHSCIKFMKSLCRPRSSRVQLVIYTFREWASYEAFSMPQVLCREKFKGCKVNSNKRRTWLKNIRVYGCIFPNIIENLWSCHLRNAWQEWWFCHMPSVRYKYLISFKQSFDIINKIHPELFFVGIHSNLRARR